MFRLGEAMSILARRVRDAVGKLAGPHALEQIQILFDGAVALGAFLAGLGQRAAILAHLVAGKIANIRLPGFDQLHGPFV